MNKKNHKFNQREKKDKSNQNLKENKKKIRIWKDLKIISAKKCL